MTVSTSAARHILFRLHTGAQVTEGLLGALRDEIVLAGWMRASGVLADVQLRALDPRANAAGPVRRLSGNVQVISLEGSIGLANGDVSSGLRAVLVREGEHGLETIAGDLVDARVVVLEVMVTAFDDITAERKLHPSGVWIAEVAAGTAKPVAAPAPAPPPPPAPAPIAAPAPAPPPAPAPVPAAPGSQPRMESEPPPAAAAAPRPSPTFSASAAMPRPIRPVAVEEEEQLMPDAGDIVEHFAFGRCEVVKTDGDRLHVRLGKDGRIKEIALEMLKVSPLDPEPGQTTKHYKLARKL